MIDLWKDLIEEVHRDVQEIRARRGLPPWDFNRLPRRNRYTQYCVSCGEEVDGRNEDHPRCLRCGGDRPAPVARVWTAPVGWAHRRRDPLIKARRRLVDDLYARGFGPRAIAKTLGISRSVASNDIYRRRGDEILAGGDEVGPGNEVVGPGAADLGG